MSRGRMEILPVAVEDFHANFVNVSCKIHTFVMIWQKDL